MKEVYNAYINKNPQERYRMAKTKTKKRGRIVRKIIITVLLLALVGGGLFFAYKSLKQEYTVNYTGYTASIGTISNSLSFSGNLTLVDSASYYATSSAKVRTVYVAAGDTVKEGDKLIRLNNGDTFTADFDGTVNSVPVEEGDEVSTNTMLVQIADFSHMRVSFRVDEYDIEDVSVGQECTITATAKEKSYQSTVYSIDHISASGGNVAYYTAVAYVDVDLEDGIYPGMQVTLTIPQEQAENVVVLKEDALSFDEQNSAYVWMYNDAGELEQVSVEVGVSNGNYVEIKSGLSDGDEVYVETVDTSSSSGLGGLLSGIFGSENVQQPGGGGMGGGGMDMSNMPDMSSMSGGSFPSMGGNSSGGGRSGSGGGGGQMGGGMP